MSKDKIEKRQLELQQEAQKIVEERGNLSRRINEINVRLEQIKGAFTELEEQKKDSAPEKEKEESKATPKKN